MSRVGFCVGFVLGLSWVCLGFVLNVVLRFCRVCAMSVPRVYHIVGVALPFSSFYVGCVLQFCCVSVTLLARIRRSPLTNIVAPRSCSRLQDFYFLKCQDRIENISGDFEFQIIV